MRGIIQLVLVEWWRSKSWMVAILLIAACAVAGPLVVAGNIDPGIVPMARSQWVYLGFFLVGWVYGPLVASGFGEKQWIRNHRLFWKAQGVTDGKYYVALVAACSVPLICLGAFTLGLLVLFGNPEQVLVSKVQAVLLTMLALGSVIPLCIGLSQLLSGAAAFFTALTVIGCGMYGPAALEFVRGRKEASEGVRVVTELVLAIIPQLRLGDQAERLTFGWAPIEGMWFFMASGYLLLWCLIFGSVGALCFAIRKA